jgi:nitrous oxidase accessory protein
VPAELPLPPRPAACTELAASEPLQAAIDAAAPGSALCLAPGVHTGPAVIEKPLTLWGPRQAVLRSSGKGTTVRIKGDHVALLGFHLDGSGSRYDTEDAAVRLTGHDLRVEGLRVTGATFGILVDQALRAVIRNNHVTGNEQLVAGMRGDSVRLWETHESRVEHNRIEHGRDIVVWYSPHNVIRRNWVAYGRYGAHFMYSGDNVVADNDFVSNVVGVFVMYSRNIELRDNRLLDASGGAGMGVGLKESGNVTLRGNLLARNTTGLYIDTSPLYPKDANVIEGNRLLIGNVGVTFHGPSAGNTFRGNELRGNAAQVVVEGGGDARASLWQENFFDDYVGYDLDGDGLGDVPYTLRSLSDALTGRVPNLAYFHGTPALGLVEIVGQLVPLMTPRTLVVDERPSMDRPRAPAHRPAGAAHAG